MNTKRLLRFYFGADKLNRAIDNLILRCACGSADPAKSGEYYAQKIIALIGAKGELGRLYSYLDGCAASLGEGELQTLKRYALSRRGTGSLEEGERREIRRCLIKFVRRARRVDAFAEGVRLVNEYYCLL